MTVPDKNHIIETLSNKHNCRLTNITRKQIMFEGKCNGQRIVVCTPKSKIHEKGSGWFDLNMAQVEILDEANIAILAVRLEGSKVYYVDFKELRKLITPELIVFSKIIGKHWKFFVWETHIQIQGSKKKFDVQPELVS
ncbi:hypothetical protein OB236_32330 [Paenibacillus sp. WQ 127069]|uniref:Uncharacterized protein n=1 Tax=Paenibacillus baimaensis TaxID=2982185 RepID=A0ABT2UQ94_9BACL|nr:hypothetical protein [Paenibacillus sp. WQ 127069]MCU6796823.1 hypothetical protein [Paenibacillus sp. WQ 127069]